MRSLGQREPVHVILRRVDDTYCDPLELRPESQLGVPGLVEATRRGDGLRRQRAGLRGPREPGARGLLPAVARHLLGRPPAPPRGPARGGAATRGAGARARAPRRARAAADVADPRQRRPCSAGRRRRPSCDSGRRRIEARPAGVGGAGRRHASERARRSAATASSRGAACCARSPSRAARLRRHARRADARRAATPAAGGSPRRPARVSKDTWVLASEPERPTGFWLQSGPATPGSGPARSCRRGAAENLWWLGRYAERAEAVTRLLRVALDRRNEFQAAHQRAAGVVGAARPARRHDASPPRSPASPATTRPSLLPTPGDELRVARRRRHPPRHARARGAAGSWPRPRRCATSSRATPGSSSARSTASSVARPRRAAGGARPRSCRACSRSAASARRAWCATSGGASWTRGGAWSAPAARRAAARDDHAGATTRRRTASCSSRSSPRRRASSRTGAATARTRSCRRCWTSCSSTRPTRARSATASYRLADDLDAMPPGDDGRLREDQRHCSSASTALRLAETASLAGADDHGRRPDAGGVPRPGWPTGSCAPPTPSSASTSSTASRSSGCRTP